MSKNNIPFKIFSGTSSLYLAEKIAKSAGVELGKSSLLRFADGEFQPSFDETVRGAIVYIVQSTFPSADNLMELLLMVDAANRASAYKTVAVIPYFGYARQDRKDKPRVSLGAKLVANLLIAAGISRMITIDLHANQIQGFFDVPVDHLYASSIFVPYINSLNLENLVLASPDTGGTKRANSYSKFLKTSLVICHKSREKANVVDEITVIGNVKDKNVIMVDDIIDTGGTIIAAGNKMMENGAKSVRVIATHPVLSGNAIEKIEKSLLTEVIVTDTIPLKKQSERIKILSVADVMADVIKKVYNNQSISSNFLV